MNKEVCRILCRKCGVGYDESLATSCPSCTEPTIEQMIGELGQVEIYLYGNNWRADWETSPQAHPPFLRVQAETPAAAIRALYEKWKGEQ